MKHLHTLTSLVWMLASTSAVAGSPVSSPAGGQTGLVGVVKSATGHALNGAMISLRNPQTGLTDTVYSKPDGRFRLPTQLSGKLELRVRAPYFRDLTKSVNLTAGKTTAHKLILAKMSSEAEISDSLPSVFHFAQLPFDAKADQAFSRANFQRDCAGCHALGNLTTRAPRTQAQWTGIVQRMHYYLGNPDPKMIADRAAILTAGFTGKPVTERPVFSVDPKIHDAIIHTYALKDAYFPHDADINATDGLMYTVDRTLNKMIITDLSDGKSISINQPPAKRAPPPNSDGYTSRAGVAGPHSLALGPSGYWYTTNSSADEIGVFDPKTRTWLDSFVIPEPGRYPHTIRIGVDGIVWFTMAASDQIGRLDPVSGSIKLIGLPRLRPLSGAGGSLPYGIDVSPLDGKIWYARLWGDKIGFIDPQTLVATEVDSPVKGPRRLRFDAAGTLWLTGYNEGMIARINPADMKTEIYPMPELAKGHRPAPYALAVHPKTQEIWINETSTDRVHRFLPQEKRFVAYPLPLRGSFTRDFAFTKAGWACTTNSPILNASLEGGATEVICIDPVGVNAKP